MYHPTRGGVRGGRDQFTWDDVKVDKHRENYLGHSIKAPVGRWQKGKDLHWYTRDKNGNSSDMEAAKEEIRRIKEQEEQAMREALGLAPKRATRPQGSRLDKHELKELVKRGSIAEDLGGGHADAVRVSGLGHSRVPRPWEESTSLEPSQNENEDSPPDIMNDVAIPVPSGKRSESDESEDERSRKKRRREEKKKEKQEKRDKQRTRDSDDKKHRKQREKRRHDSD